MGKTIRLSFCLQKLGEPKILCHLYSVIKNGLQKFQGKFYVLAALNGMLFGNPLQKFFCGFGFVEF
jgi:hypothetical protein